MTTAASIDHHTVTRDALERDPEFMWAYVKQLYTEFEEAQSSLTASEKDAARYRWLRDGNNESCGIAVEIAQDMYGTDWDEEIDAAMEKSNG